MADQRPPFDAAASSAPTGRREPIAPDEDLHEQRRQDVLERLAHLGSWSWRPATGEMRWSAGFYRLIGRAPERQPAGYEALIGLIHPEDKSVFLLQLETALQRNTPLSIDHRIVLPDGSAREVHTEAECVVPGGRGEEWMAVTRQLTPAEEGEPLRRIAEALPDVLWLRTLDYGATLYVSRAYEHLWGRSRRDLFRNPRAFMESVVPEDYARLGQSLECHTQGCAYEVEYRVRHPRGVRWVRERGFPLRDARGELWAMAAIVADITEWKQEDTDLRGSLRESGRRQRDLQRQAAQLQGMLDDMPVAVLRCDELGRVSYANTPTERLLGWPAGELAGVDFVAAAFPDPEERQRLLEFMGRALPEWRDFVTRDRSGEAREFAWSFMRSPDGSYLAFGIDVHERRNMERRLRESEANFRSVYESNAVPFYFWRIDGRITGANDAYLGLLGYSREDLEQGRLDWVSLTPAEYRERDQQVLGEQLAGRTVAEPFEKELVRKDGSRVPVLAGGALFPDRRGGVAFAIDLRERKESEARLRQLNAELNAAMTELKAGERRAMQIEKLTALGTLAAGVAHELNNPMMAVMNYVDYACRSARGDAAESLGKALAELERMSDLLQNMLAFAQPVPEPVRRASLRRIVDNALVLMGPDLNERGIAVEVEIDAGLPEVAVKELQLQQAVVSLLMNARDALESAAEKRIWIRAHRHDGFAALQVEDSGPGIPEAIRAQIFDPFFTTKPPGRGTGLGLSISRSILLESGGDLYFQEGAHRGALFTLLIPVAERRD